MFLNGNRIFFSILRTAWGGIQDWDIMTLLTLGEPPHPPDCDRRQTGRYPRYRTGRFIRRQTGRCPRCHAHPRPACASLTGDRQEAKPHRARRQPRSRWTGPTQPIDYLLETMTMYNNK